MEIVERSLLDLAALGGVEQAVPAGADTDGGAEPLTEVQVRGKTDLAHSELLFNGGVHTRTDGDEGVVENAVRHIGTTDDLSVGANIVILLCESAEGKETCSRKNSNEFDDFHNTMLSLIASIPVYSHTIQHANLSFFLKKA